MKEKEAKARIKINKLLEDAGWRFFDTEDNRANIQVEPNIKISKQQVDLMGENFDKVKNGFVDFLLLDDKGHPFIVLEAKSENKDPLIGKEQAREYAKTLYIKYVILSNGNQHYFWNIYKGNPQIITRFPNCESIKEDKALNADISRLYNEEVYEDYIALIKKPRYAENPDFKNPETREQFKNDNGIRFLRPYQLNAIKAIQKSVKRGNQRFLLEMATGTGKTLTSAAIIRLFLRSGNAHRILFLVDRIELENQAKKNFRNYLTPDYHTVVFKENIEDWRKAEVVISTVQTLMFNSKYKEYFKPTDFSLLIIDESHRSVNGNYRAIFEYFLGYKLGLTATPKDYIKNVDITKLKSTDPRAWEKRQLLDSYKTFGCESGEPTYRYSLLDGVRDGFLITPTVVDARTDITTQLLADNGYAVFNQIENSDEHEEPFFVKDFEKRFYSEETNRIFVNTFIENAIYDPLSGEIGKTIIFCVSRKHAAKIVQLLNEVADKCFPNMYYSDFAMQITSDVMNAQYYTINFQNNNLSGTSNFLENYKTSKTRVCVTVGMMTTGYDCEDLLNIVLLRPIFSPTDFIQIKGRGTRKYEFNYKEYLDGLVTSYKEEKKTFKLFDFFGNCEYFEKKFNYDETINLPKSKFKETESKTITTSRISYENFGPDSIKLIMETQIGYMGMKIDRMFFDKFENKVKDDITARKQYEQGNYSAVQFYIEEKIMNKPSEYYTWEKLKQSIGIDRRVTVQEILDKIFGSISSFKSKRELMDDEFETFQLTRIVSIDKYAEIRRFFETYIIDKDVRRIIEDEKFQLLGTEVSTYTMSDLRSLGIENMKQVVDYINDNVNISRFTT